MPFHDATIAAIERDEASYVLHVEDVSLSMTARTSSTVR